MPSGIYKHKKHTNPNCQCASCKSKRGESFGKKASNFKDGHCINNVCIECKTKISPQAKRCKKCYSYWQKTNLIGNKNHAFIKGDSLKKHFCIDCKVNEISYPNWLHGNKRCQSCHAINLWKKDKNKRLKYIFDSMRLKPNKPEKILMELFKKLKLNYKYVGNGKVWINGFNPDFIDKKNKKIIELYGDYWHNTPKAIERNKKRIRTYKKYGYETLVIWEHELNNPNNVINKII